MFIKGKAPLNTGRTRFKKGLIPWNKGLKGFQKGRKITWGDKISVGKKNSLKSTLASKEAARRMHIANKGRMVSMETRKKMSISHIGKTCGEKSGMWKGGTSYEPYSIDWTKTLKRSIRERDHYICQICSMEGHQVHHIDYNKKDCNPNNLITLCRRCHSLTNNNRESWINYFGGLHRE